MDISIRKMELKDWKYVSKIYVEGINTGNANFGTNLPSWDKWNLDRSQSVSLWRVMNKLL